MSEAAGIISRSGYVLNPAILGKLKGVINAEIVVSDPGGRIMRTTFAWRADPEDLGRVLRKAGERTSTLSSTMLGG